MKKYIVIICLSIFSSLYPSNMPVLFEEPDLEKAAADRMPLSVVGLSTTTDRTSLINRIYKIESILFRGVDIALQEVLDAGCKTVREYCFKILYRLGCVDGQTLLHQAALLKDDDAIQRLITIHMREQWPILNDDKDNYPYDYYELESLLRITYSCGMRRVASVLEKARAQKTNDDYLVDLAILLAAGSHKKQGTLLHQAARLKNSHDIQVLLSLGADPMLVDADNKMASDYYQTAALIQAKSKSPKQKSSPAQPITPKNGKKIHF